MFPLGVLSQGAVATPFWSHTWSTRTNPQATTSRLGYKFTVGGSPFVCNTLAVHMNSDFTERVRVHRWSDGALIATADILSSPNTWVTQAVTEFVLAAGTAYTVSYRRANGLTRITNYNSTGFTMESGLTFDQYVFGADDNLPSGTASFSHIGGRFGYV